MQLMAAMFYSWMNEFGRFMKDVSNTDLMFQSRENKQKMISSSLFPVHALRMQTKTQVTPRLDLGKT